MQTHHRTVKNYPINSAHSSPYLRTHRFPHLLDLVLGNQRDHSMRSDAEVVGREPSPQTENAAHFHLLECAVDGTLEGHLARHWIRLHLLDLRLHEVKGQTEGGGCETSNGTSTENLHWRWSSRTLEQLLGLSVECKHTKIKCHSTGGGGQRTFEQSKRPFPAYDGPESMSYTSVVASLCPC